MHRINQHSKSICVSSSIKRGGHRIGNPWFSHSKRYKNRVRFGATVTFNEPYVAQSCQAFQCKMSIEAPSIQPRYLFGRQPTPDLRFNQKPFGIPSLLFISRIPEGEKGRCSFKLHIVGTCKCYNISSRLVHR